MIICLGFIASLVLWMLFSRIKQRWHCLTSEDFYAQYEVGYGADDGGTFLAAFGTKEAAISYAVKYQEDYHKNRLNPYGTGLKVIKVLTIRKTILVLDSYLGYPRPPR